MNKWRLRFLVFNEKIKYFWVKFNNFSKQKPIRVIFQLLAIGFIGFLIIKNYSSFKSLTRELTINYTNLGIAFFLLFFTVFFIGVTSWFCINRGLGQKLSWSDAAKVQLISNVSKYLPGTLWQYASKAYLSRNLGVSREAIPLAIVYEFGQTIWTGICIICIFIPERIGSLQISPWVRQMFIIIGIIGTIGSIIFPYVIRSSLQRIIGQQNKIAPWFLFISTNLIIVGWGLSVFAFWILSIGFAAIDITSLPGFFFAYASSLVGGILAIPIPNGLGVREGIFIATLHNYLPDIISLVLSGVLRIEIIFGELLGAILIWVETKLRIFTKM